MQLYDLIKKVSRILTPETDSFYNYILHTSDDDGGFLRTRYCWWDKCLEDKELDDEYKKVLVTSQYPIDIDALTNEDATYVKLQFHYEYAGEAADDADIDVVLGYGYIYIFDLEKGSFTMEHREMPY